MKQVLANCLFLRPALIVLVLIAPGRQAIDAQENRSNTVQLLRLDGSFSIELPARIDSEGQSQQFGFSLLKVKLEAEEMGFLTRLQSRLTISNGHAKQKIGEIEWQLDIFDEALGSLSRRVLQSNKMKVYPGETGTASTIFGAVLPDRMVVLFQLVRVSFEN